MNNEYTGIFEWTPSDEELSEFYQTYNFYGLNENQYLFIKDKDGKVLDQYKVQNGKLEKVGFTCFKNEFSGLTKPRNPEQIAAFDMLNDKNSTVKLITGGFGCGKTFALVTAALDALQHGKFDKIVWVRNNIEVKDTVPLGALPGDEFTKLLPWVMPMCDHAGGVEGIRTLIENGQLEVVHLGYLRGRDIRNSIIICSESENMTKEHIQLCIGRVGEGSNLWMDADLKQRDKSIFEKSAGLELMIDRLKGNPLFAYVKLKKTERSATAQLADLLD